MFRKNGTLSGPVIVMMPLHYLLLFAVLQTQFNIAQSVADTAFPVRQERSTSPQQGNTGNEFYVAFMDNHIRTAFQYNDSFILNRSKLFITTNDPSGAIVMIESEQGTSMNYVAPGETLTKTMQGFKVQSGRDRGKGIKIKAEQSKQISVFALNEEFYSTEGFTAFPCSPLPSVSIYKYFAVSVPSQGQVFSPLGTNTADSAFLIVACSDNTVVSITPTQSIEHPYFANHTVIAGSTFSVTLQERETLYVQSREDLTGSKVESTAPISFFTGHECGNVPADIGECDHLVEQIPPTVTWGNQFIVAPIATRRADDIIKIVSSENNTRVNVTCTLDVGIFNIALVQAGNFEELYLTNDTYCFIETDKAVLVVQFTEANSEDSGDLFMVIVPAVRQYLENVTFATVSGVRDNYVNIFVPAGANELDTLSILIDGGPISLRYYVNWVSVRCSNGDVCGYATQVSIREGVHSIENANGGPVGVMVYSFYYFKTYGYVGGIKLFVPGYEVVPCSISHFIFPGGYICMPCRNGTYEGNRLSTRAAWSKSGQYLPYSQHTPFQELVSERMIIRNHSLCIENVQYSDEGNYTCHLSGETFNSTLIVADGIILEPPMCDAPPDIGALIGIGQDTVYLDSSTKSLQICCRVEGPPGYTVTWKRNGSFISRNERSYEFGEDYMRYSGNMTPGCVVFTCHVDFPTTTRNESSKVCIGDIAPPTVVNITGRERVWEHYSATYKCSADGFPPPTKMWSVAYRDDKNPLPDNANDDGNGFLYISSVTEADDSRMYCCDVSNTLGEILSSCITVDVIFQPSLIKGYRYRPVIVSVPYGATLPLETGATVVIRVGQPVWIPETYNLKILCRTYRDNIEASIEWYWGETVRVKGPQYTVQEDGTLVINNVVSDRDDGQYVCVATTPGGRSDRYNSTVRVTVLPRINRSHENTSPGNCLDLTENLENIQQVGQNLCLRAGPGAMLTLECNVVEGKPYPSKLWLKDGRDLYHALDAGTYQMYYYQKLMLYLPTVAYGRSKENIDGNYTCVAYNEAGNTSMETDITLFGDIPTDARGEFVRAQTDVYLQLYKTVSEHFPGVQDGSEHLTFLTSGKVLSYEDFDPGYLYDDSEESILPQTMENMFDLVDVIPDGGSIVFNPHRANRLRETYNKLLDMLQVAPSSLPPDEQQRIRYYFQEFISDPGSSQVLPRLSLYLLYKNTYYMTKIEVDNLIESQRQSLLDFEFTQWYEHNIHSLQMKISDAYMKWEMYADKAEVEEYLNTLNLEDNSQNINTARALLLSSQRMSRFKDEKEYYLVKLYPDTWYKRLKNRVQESIEQMQFQLSQLKTEVQILELTSQYLDKKMREREALNALFPSLDPIYLLYCDLDVATHQLERLVRESEDMRYKCLISGNPADCHLYWGLQEHIRDQVLGNFTEFYWYVHTVQAALNHRDYSIPAIASTIRKLKVQVTHMQSAIDVTLSQLSDRDERETGDDRDFFTDFMYRRSNLSSISEDDFQLPSSLVERLLWYINSESTRLLPTELTHEYNLSVNHLNTARTNVSAKLSKVSIHRRWLKTGLFGNKHLKLVNPEIVVSPGDIRPPEFFRKIVKNGTYQLPLYPTSLLLATDIELTVDVPFIFHTLPTLIKLSYDPHITGGFGPFLFGPLHRASAGNIKFRVGIRDNQITITLPGTQLIGFVCDVVPKHPAEYIQRGRRSTSLENDFHDVFDNWSYWRDFKLQDKLFHKSSNNREQLPDSPTHDDVTESLISPTVPLNNLHTPTMSAYYNSTL